MAAGGPARDEASLETADTFGTVLRRFRVRAGLSQEDLAERAGISARAIGTLEQGLRRRPYPHTVSALAEALELAPAELDELLESTRATERASPSSGARDPARQPLPEQPEVESVRLPVWLTSFVGREAEVENVCALLDPVVSPVRLVTLLGPGGVGKTRLAVAAADRLSPAYLDGVAFVDLAPVTDPRLVPATIARALDVRAIGGRSARDLLLEQLRERQVLLVLDNFEHLLTATALLAELLQECPKVALLTTSRIALRLRAERRLHVGSLATPRDDLAAVEDLAASPAVRLFVERAHAVAPDFALDASVAPAVAAICRRLDGMPLAIELAAARAGLLRPQDLLRRLERSLPLLTHGSADMPERQQTLRQTLAWSYYLLRPVAQMLFRRLSVFADGWTLEAAEGVCGGGDLAPDDILEPLSELVDNSLVNRTIGSAAESRFGMLETVREYAAERLVENAEDEATKRLHAAFYLELAERAVPEFRGPHLATWLDRLDYERANFRAALRWLSGQNDLDGALRLATAGASYWLRAGVFADAQPLIPLLNATATRRDSLRAAALLAAARLASKQGDYPAQARFDDEGLRLFRELGDPAGIAEAVTDLGVAMWQQGFLDEAETYATEGLRHYQALQDSLGMTTATLPLAAVERDRGNFEKARVWYAEALAHSRACGEQLLEGHALNNMGWLELYAGNLAAARQLAGDALAIRRAIGARQDVGVSLTLMATVAFAAGEPEVARPLFADSLAVHLEVGNRWGIALVLEGVACLAASIQPERALRLAGAADALRTAIGRPLPPAERPLVTGWLEPARLALGPDPVTGAWANGQTLSDAQAVAEALDILSTHASI